MFYVAPFTFGYNCSKSATSYWSALQKPEDHPNSLILFEGLTCPVVQENGPNHSRYSKKPTKVKTFGGFRRHIDERPADRDSKFSKAFAAKFACFDLHPGKFTF